MTTNDASTVLQVASTLDESGSENLAMVATILRGLLGEIQDKGNEISTLRAQITEMQSNASTAAFEKVNDQLAEANRENANLRAQVATLSAGKAWIPEPTLADLDGELSRVWPVADGWRKGFLACIDWAREHAVAPVVVPEEITPIDIDAAWNAYVDANPDISQEDDADWLLEIFAHAIRQGASIATSRLRPILADRILQDGERAVDSRRFDRMLADESERPYLLELEQYVRTMARLQNWSRDTTGHGPLNRLDALRAKKEGGQE